MISSAIETRNLSLAAMTGTGDKSPSQMIIPNARDAAHNGHSWLRAA
jgi:hypothetical protein